MHIHMYCLYQHHNKPVKDEMHVSKEYYWKLDNTKYGNYGTKTWHQLCSSFSCCL